jgi:hypothetical protein
MAAKIARDKRLAGWFMLSGYKTKVAAQKANEPVCFLHEPGFACTDIPTTRYFLQER